MGLTRLLSQTENPIALSLPLLSPFLISLHSINTTVFLPRVFLSYVPFQFPYLTVRWRSSREAPGSPQKHVEWRDFIINVSASSFLGWYFIQRVTLETGLALDVSSCESIWFSITWSYPLPVRKNCQGKPLMPCVCWREVLISLHSVLSGRSWLLWIAVSGSTTSESCWGIVRLWDPKLIRAVWLFVVQRPGL